VVHHVEVPNPLGSQADQQRVEYLYVCRVHQLTAHLTVDNPLARTSLGQVLVESNPGYSRNTDIMRNLINK